MPDWCELRADVAALHAAALAAAEPAAAVSRALVATDGALEIGGKPIRLSPGSQVFLLAAGKAAVGMTRGALRELSKLTVQGLVVTPHRLVDGGSRCAWPPGVRQLFAAHPLPDEASLRAGDAARAMLAGTKPEDVVVVLLSGGASSLLEILRPGLTLEQLRRVTDTLLRAGADVRAINTVRRAMSLVKGGGLARLAAPARIVTLAMSDVVGDGPETIASGPTVRSLPDSGEALRTLRESRAAAAVPEVEILLESDGKAPPPVPESEAGVYHIVASNADAAMAVRKAAERRGFRAQVSTVYLQGEAREAGRTIGGCALSMRRGLPFPPPGCLIFGGETTVTVRGAGRGGRNQELALGAAIALAGAPRAAVFSFATDGVDGHSDAAGALATGETLRRAASQGLSPYAALADNDSEAFFGALGDLVRGGPTGTNVNDLAIALAYL